MNKPEIFGAISKLAWCPDCLASQLSYISCGIQNWNWIIAQGTISRQSCRMNHHCRLIRICRRQESPPSERTWKPRHSIRSEQSFLMATWTFLSPRHEGWLVVVLTMPSRASLPSCCWCLPPCRSCCGALRGIHIEWLLATEGLLCVKCRITFLLHRVSVTFVACKDTNGKKWIL